MNWLSDFMFACMSGRISAKHLTMVPQGQYVSYTMHFVQRNSPVGFPKRANIYRQRPSYLWSEV